MLAAILTFLLTISGCANWRGIKPQQHPRAADTLDAGAAIRADVAAADQQAQWPRGDWWRAYGDPQLDALVAAAHRDNPSQAIAAARLQEAAALAGEARADTLPTLSGSAQLDRHHWPESGYYNGGFGGDTTFDNSAMLHLAYPLDLFGARRNGAAQALDVAHAAAAEARSAQLDLDSSVVRAYIALALTDEVAGIERRTLDDQQYVLTLAQRRLRAGLATQLEISEAQAPLPRSRLALEQTQARNALLRHQLAALIGQGPGAGDALASPSLHFGAQLTQASMLPSALPAQLLGHRPDIVALRWRIEAQTRAIDVSKAAFYPNIDLLASGGGSAVGDVFSTFTRLSSMGFNAGPAISLPIFEGGRLRAELGASTARYDLAVAQYNDAVLRAMREIADQVVTIRSLYQQQQQAAAGLASTQRSFDLASSGFKRGLTDYLNVLAAEDRLLAEQQSVAAIASERLQAYADLMTALGGGVAAIGPDEASR